MAAKYDNRISLQKLEVFCLVVELGGVSRAAEHLFVAQPVVTAHLQSLQKRLGITLLYRDGRRMRLTDSGERVYEWARETLSRTRELMRELDGLAEGQRGSVAVAASMTVGSYTLPRVLARFRAERPSAQVTLAVSEPERAVEAVQSGECDFAVVVADAPPDNPLVQARVVGHEDIVLVAAPDYHPRIKSLPVSELAGTPMVSSPAGHIRRNIVDALLAERGAQPRNVVMELGHPEAMKRATQDGLGMCLLFRSSVEQELADRRLRQVAITDAQLTVPLITVLRADKRLSPIQRELLDTIADEILRDTERRSRK